MKNRPTAARLRELLHYEPLTGVFTRRVDVSHNARAGDRAGTVNKVHGYVLIGVDGTQYFGHCLAVLYMTGEWPDGDVDHKDTDRSNLVWLNLRDVTPTINAQNQRRARVDNESSGLLGVTRIKTGWKAQIGLRDSSGKRRTKNLGHFDSKEQAHRVYVIAKRQLHAGCTL